MTEINDAAKILGSIKSEKKAKAARINGTKPCAPGKKRGNPLKIRKKKNV